MIHILFDNYFIIILHLKNKTQEYDIINTKYILKFINEICTHYRNNINE